MLFKDYFNTDYINRLSQKLEILYPSFNLIYLQQTKALLPSLEMRDRVNIVADAIYNGFENQEKIFILKTLISLAHESQEDWREFGAWPIITAFERHFTDDFEHGMQGLYALTPIFSAEFAIRPFILYYPEEVFKKLEIWAKDKDDRVRRLASEGIRTKLPWGGKVPYLNENPQKILNILNLLKSDDSLFVRRSVANNLNDLSKDYPELILKTLKEWQDDSDECKWLTKHALRTLIKKGEAKALALIGMDIDFDVDILDFSISSTQLTLGEDFLITLSLKNNENKNAKLVLDYIIHHVKANGQTSPKVFKWKNIQLKAKESLNLKKKHKIYPITTRQYYEGTHKLEVTLNGKIIAAKDFKLKC